MEDTWHTLQSQPDVDRLMHTYRGFHDSCLKELVVQTREYVDERLAMHFDNRTVVKLRFQSQYSENSTLELLFEDIVAFNWMQDERNADPGHTIILEAVCRWENDMVYWAEDIDWALDAADRNDYRWVAAKQARWRTVTAGSGPASTLFNYDY